MPDTAFTNNLGTHLAWRQGAGTGAQFAAFLASEPELQHAQEVPASARVVHKSHAVSDCVRLVAQLATAPARAARAPDARLARRGAGIQAAAPQ